jgi:DNA-binding NarL/FixJ family response regulator
MQKILIVDDSTLFRKVFRETLHSRFPSLMILEAKDGKEALEAILTWFPDVIFMDINLDNENGLELTRLIKGQFPEIKVIILTSYDLPEYRKEAIRYKADHYVPKDSFMSVVNVIFSRVPSADDR